MKDKKIYAQNFTDPLLLSVTSVAGVSLQFVNPIGAKLVLSSATEIQTITVSNTLGQQILQQKVHAKVFTASTATWKPGVYYVSLTFNNGASKGIKILKQ